MEEPGVLAFSPLQQWAAHVHEMYEVLQQAGFTAEEALGLVASVLANSD